MADYKDIIGLDIEAKSANPTNVVTGEEVATGDINECCGSERCCISHLRCYRDRLRSNFLMGF